MVGPTDAGAETAAAPDVDGAAAEPSGESPRQRYNRALEQLQGGSPAAAADGFLAARDTAGPDPELRYRAAFNLGVALAGEADASSDAPGGRNRQAARQRGVVPRCGAAGAGG